MIRATLTPPWVSMAEAVLPQNWTDARNVILANSPWMLLLVTFERAFEGHYFQAVGAFLLCLVALGIAVHWKAFEGLGKRSGRRRLAFILITIGLVFLGAGIYFLAMQRPLDHQVFVRDPPTADDIAKATAPVRAELEDVKRELDITKGKLEGAERQLQAARNAPATGPEPLPAKQGPITWHVNSQLMVVSGGAPNAVVNGLLFMGTSTASVSIKDAYVVSGLTGRKQVLMANVQSKGGYYPVDKVDIPPDAPVQLDAIFDPGLPLRDFMDQWGKFRVTIIYSNGGTYERDYDEAFVRQQLRQHIPNAFGPRVTPRDEK